MGSLPAHHAARDPDCPAVTHDDVTLSWRELEARANRRAHLFAARGVGEGDFVTIALPNGIAFHETPFAIWKLGATHHRKPAGSACVPALDPWSWRLSCDGRRTKKIDALHWPPTSWGSSCPRQAIAALSYCALCLRNASCNAGRVRACPTTACMP
jgi:hypothetical protein